jgi:hypothetical protein
VGKKGWFGFECVGWVVERSGGGEMGGIVSFEK